MAKPLDPKAIEAERQTSSRAERREQKRRQMQDEISYNQRGNGVIIIPPQKRRELAEEPSKLRVAAYCRVSTQEEQQVGSFDMQIHHFTKRIEANPQWELVEIYQDEGISATTVEKRLGFQKMIAAIEAGYISAVFVKDLSRLGRNYIEVGKLTEKFFLLHDIRLVAVSDGVDSDEGEDDFTQFKNIMKNISHLGKVSNDFSLFGRF